jgi:acyl-CoA synthetase (AMP-forming)/AMP-acid ligase II
MKFIGQVSPGEDSQKNILTDGGHTCTYKEIPTYFEAIDRVFSEKDIGIEYPLVLECENTLPAALTLLYLLEHNYSFLTVPVRTGTDAANPPRFCRYKITVKTQEISETLNPRSFLQIDENRQWNGKKDTGGKLFLRTSGSTGIPKIAVHPHTQLRGNGLNCVERLKLSSNDRIAVPVPIFHMFGLGAAFLPAVAVQSSVDLQKGANLLRYMQRERAFNPNVAFMTPVFSETLLKGRKSPRLYRLTVTAGDRFRGDDAFVKYESLFGCLISLYGSTEMGAISASSPDDPLEDRSKTAGRPMSGVQLRTEKTDQTPENEAVGEILCCHDCGFAGYIDEDGNPLDSPFETDPAENRKWFRTKDMGRIRPDGRLEVAGRCDHSINRDGLLVFFADVENALKRIDGIDAAVVVSKGESLRGKGLLAYCVPAKESSITETAIRSACFERLPHHAVPDEIVLLGSLPLLPSGKVDRQKLSN